MVEGNVEAMLHLQMVFHIISCYYLFLDSFEAGVTMYSKSTSVTNIFSHDIVCKL